MPVTAAHQLNSMYVDTDAVPTTTIGGITRQTINTGIEVIKENSSGSLWPEAAWVVRNAPSAALSTTHCKEFLAAVGVRGSCITSEPPTTGVHLWARKLQCSGIAAGSSHQKYTFRNGIIVPMAMACDHQGNASIEFVLFGVETNTLASMLVATSEAIAGSVLPNTDRWSIYKVAAGGNLLTGAKSLGVGFGNAPILESGDYDTAPTFASVMETAPVVSVRGIDPVGWWAGTGGLSGLPCTHANTTIWLKKRGVAIDGGTAEHMKITMNGTAHTQQAFDASGNATGEQDLIIEGTESTAGIAPLLLTFEDNIT